MVEISLIFNIKKIPTKFADPKASFFCIFLEKRGIKHFVLRQYLNVEFIFEYKPTKIMKTLTKRFEVLKN